MTPTKSLIVPTLQAPPFRLRLLRMDDVEMVMQAATDPYIATFTTIPKDADRESAADFIGHQLQKAASGEGYPFAIADEDTDEAIGFLGLWLHEKERVFLGYWLVPAARGRGAAALCLARVAAWATSQGVAPELKLYIEPWNNASIKTAETAGFIKGDLLPGFRKIGDEYRDVIEYRFGDEIS